MNNFYKNIFDELDDNLCTPNYEKIRANPNLQDWIVISFYKKLTKEFIIEFADYINFKAIIYNKQISQDIKDYCRMFI